MPSWTYERYPTSAIDKPEGLGATHYELKLDDSVLPYLSHENHKLLLRLIAGAIKCRKRSKELIGEIPIGNERIIVCRVRHRIIIGAAKDWKFSLPEAEALCRKMIST